MKSLLTLFLFFSAAPAFALDFTPPDITTMQGTGDAGQNLAGWVQSFYMFSMVGGVFLAVGVIVWAGLRYTLAAGNPSTQSDARDQILQALLGLVLLFGAYLILFTINPDLTKLTPPTLQSVSVQAPTGAAGGADVVLPADVQAEINPNVNVVFTRTISGANQLPALRNDCSQLTAGKGTVAQKTVPNSSSIVYVCETQK